MTAPRRDRFLELLRSAVADGTLTKLTLGRYRGADKTMRNLYIHPVNLKGGPHLAFVWRHANRDVTKNLPPEAALGEITRLIGTDFLDAHLFTTTHTAQLETQSDGDARVRIRDATAANTAASKTNAQTHDETKQYLIPPQAPWLRALGVTNERGHPREGMADKYRQIQKFAELLSHLIDEAFPRATPGEDRAPLQVCDMGSGKGYLTFAVSALLREHAQVRGIEARPELVALCNEVASACGFASHLAFTAGNIANAAIEHLDVLLALHACDTATDDALARGIQAGARLLVVAPCCQKEIRPQLQAPPVLADALRHGIFQERQAEFVTDALRAQLLEWAGYRAKVFEFISTEHTAKNVMIAATRIATPRSDADIAALADRTRDFAAFYGVRTQRLAQHLGFALTPIPNFVPEKKA